MLRVTDFVPKGVNSGVKVQAGLYLDMLDADRLPNAVSVHAGTSQVDFEVDCLPLARSTRRSFDHHEKGNGNFHGQQCNVTYRKPGQDLPGSNPVVSHFFTLIILYRET